MDRSAEDTVTVDAGGLRPDVVTVDALARLQLAAKRSGRGVRLTRVSPDLRELIELCGLAEVLPADVN
jgi:anti-anti-sigma regulatory factor